MIIGSATCFKAHGAIGLKVLIFHFKILLENKTEETGVKVAEHSFCTFSVQLSLLTDNLFSKLSGS